MGAAAVPGGATDESAMGAAVGMSVAGATVVAGEFRHAPHFKGHLLVMKLFVLQSASVAVLQSDGSAGQSGTGVGAGDGPSVGLGEAVVGLAELAHSPHVSGHPVAIIDVEHENLAGISLHAELASGGHVGRVEELRGADVGGCDVVPGVGTVVGLRVG